VPVRWLVGGIILLFSSMLVGLPPLALSILFTMAITRLLIDPFWRFVEARPWYFWWMVLLLIFGAWASDLLVEYGTMGFLLACAGYGVRHREEVAETIGKSVPQTLMMAAYTAFGVFSCVKFGFSLMACMVVAAGLIGTYFVLQDFESRVLPGTANRPATPLVHFLGRYTLEIYVLHLVLLKAIFGLRVLAFNLIG
jgi:hypothetical protein